MKHRNWQDSNLRSQRESDFESDAITTRPQLLPRLKVLGVLNQITLKIMGKWYVRSVPFIILLNQEATVQ